jgi:hypothetical protein
LWRLRKIIFGAGSSLTALETPKNCQEGSLQTNVMTLDFTRLPRQNTPNNVAGFTAGLGILTIEGKKEKGSPASLFLRPAKRERRKPWPPGLTA